MLAVAALDVAAIGGSGLARLPWIDLGVCPARLPSRWDLLLFQHVLGIVVVLLVLCLFLLLTVQILGVKNEATFFELFPLCMKGDVVDLKMLAEYVLVEEDLLSNCVFEKGFDVTPLQVARAIDAMVARSRQRGSRD